MQALAGVYGGMAAHRVYVDPSVTDQGSNASPGRGVDRSVAAHRVHVDSSVDVCVAPAPDAGQAECVVAGEQAKAALGNALLGQHLRVCMTRWSD